MAKTLGERIKEAREAKRLTIAELASRVGAKEDAIRKLETVETGKIGQCAFIRGVRIAIELDVSAEYLALGDETYLREAERHSLAKALREAESLLVQIRPLAGLASTFQDRARAALKRITQG